MRIVLLVAILLSTVASAEEVPVTLQVRRLQSWCGGVHPPPDFSYDNPYAGAKIELFPGNILTKEQKPIAVTADASGSAMVKLAPGTWCVAEAGRQAKVGSKPPPRANAACWARAMTKCEAVITVKPGNAASAKVEVARSCPWSQPCLPPGPKPPSAPRP